MSISAPTFDVGLAHRWFAAECFNLAWTLIDKPARSTEDDEQMLLLAQASLWHWTQRDDCTDQNRSIGYWLLARVCAVLGDATTAHTYGERCLKLAGNSPPFFIAYAHEALARAALVAGDDVAFDLHLNAARDLSLQVTEPEERHPLDVDLSRLANSHAG